MCGISGWVAKKRWNFSVLSAMTNSVRHRGPDGEGYSCVITQERGMQFLGRDQFSEKVSSTLALGHRRLSILDLSTRGAQPMASRDEKLWITYNGEVYNHVELRKELEGFGFRFESATDTEVILNAWEQWGADCLDRLNGMFAFLLYDQCSKTLHAIRDRFGIKPLYFFEADDGNSISFASEIKQFQHLPHWNPKVNSDVAYDFLAWGLQDHRRETFFQGVYQLKPGERMEVDVSELGSSPKKLKKKIVSWYKLPNQVTPSFKNLDESAKALKKIMQDSVRLRLRADVEVGTCLSGGIDSSSIVCLMDDRIRKQGKGRQRTFSALAEDSKLDEGKWMKLVLEGKDIQASFVMPKFDNLADELSQLIYSQDEPFGSAGIFIQRLVFKLAKEAGVKVLLDGQGADELFGGYETYRACALAGMLSKGNFCQSAKEIISLWRMGNVVGRTLFETADYLMPQAIRMKVRELLGKNHIEPTWLNLKKLGVVGYNSPDSFGSRSKSIQSLNYAQIAYTSLPKLLHWEDRNSMASSVEGRVPFLDYRLVEFAMSLPDELKVSRGVTKSVLREAMNGVLPNTIRNRNDKIGFAASETEWFVHKRPDWFLAGIDKAMELGGGLFESGLKKEASNMVERGSCFDVRYWRALCFGEWMDCFSTRLN